MTTKLFEVRSYRMAIRLHICPGIPGNLRAIIYRGGLDNFLRQNYLYDVFRKYKRICFVKADRWSIEKRREVPTYMYIEIKRQISFFLAT